MKNNRSLKRQEETGSAILMIVFLLLVLLPLTMILVKWVSPHLRGNARARLHMDEYYAGTAAANAARLNAVSWYWNNLSAPINNQVVLGSGTVVSVQITYVGTP
jgi:ACR3 family arsenite efflux pump ArsB